MGNVREVLESQHDTFNNISWAAYHASHQPSQSHAICPTALLPLFLESAHTVAMIKHSFHVVKSAIEHLNPGQTPVIAFDQPLYALAKHIQWKWPENYGEDKFVIMFGGLHIEMAALKTLGDWLKGSGWVQALVHANITTPGIADSFLQAAHVTRTIRAHQVTVAALYILMHRAYDHYCLTSTEGEQQIMEFKQWCNQREQVCPHFQYWATVMELEICVLVYVHSLRQASFTMYLDALTELTPWFFALDHTNYARWIPVHLKDMAELSTKHPEIAKRFDDGHFTIQKTNRVFSAIPIDQAHEQNNGYIKGDGGAVGLTDNPNALRRWMIAGPEVARIIEEFHDEHHHCGGVVLTGALVQLSCAPSDIPEDVMLTIERFVILLYDRTSTCTDINKARQKIFAKRNNIKRIPPTRAALEQHVKRATYQGGHVWGQSLQTTPVLPSPTNWGWTRTDDGLYEPNWTILPEASQVCYELVSCKCKKGCVGQCKCKKAALECTALCACEGECS